MTNSHQSVSKKNPETLENRKCGGRNHPTNAFFFSKRTCAQTHSDAHKQTGRAARKGWSTQGLVFSQMFLLCGPEIDHHFRLQRRASPDARSGPQRPHSGERGGHGRGRRVTQLSGLFQPWLQPSFLNLRDLHLNWVAIHPSTPSISLPVTPRPTEALARDKSGGGRNCRLHFWHVLQEAEKAQRTPPVSLIHKTAGRTEPGLFVCSGRVKNVCRRWHWHAHIC